MRREEKKGQFLSSFPPSLPGKTKKEVAPRLWPTREGIWHSPDTKFSHAQEVGQEVYRNDLEKASSAPC